LEKTQNSVGGDESPPQLRKQETGKSRKQVSISENPKAECLSPQVDTRKVNHEAKQASKAAAAAKRKKFGKSLSSEGNVVLKKQVNP